MSSSSSFLRRTARQHPRRDYNAMNNGMDSLPSESSTDIYEDHSSSESPRGISLDRELSPADNPMPSQGISLTQPETPQPPSSSLPMPSEGISLTQPETPQPPSSSLPTSPLLGKRKRKDKSYSTWALEYFWVTDLDKTWSRKNGVLKKDRLLSCKKCSWSSTDSARHGSTSNLLTHLQTKHGIKSASSSAPSAPGTSLDRFLAGGKAKLSLEQALIRWVVETRQPFTAIEHPAFQAMFTAVDANLPIKTADTLRNRIKDEFDNKRSHLRTELETCHSIALSLDGWTSENQVGILGVIGHWTTEDFEKREAMLEFTEIRGPHSGENLTEILVTMLEDLQIGPKLLTITGDNAGNNGTLCDHLHSELRKKYDDEDDQFRMKPLMRFRGRNSFIPCLAHVINLICKDLLTSLKAGSSREAKVLLDELASQRDQTFSSTHAAKGAIVRIRLLVLWIARSPQRRQEWKVVSPAKQVSYDVDTRWNSTYIMISDALRLRKELRQFVRNHPEVHALQLTDEEWLALKQVAKVLKPFWDFTNQVSETCPTIVESLSIYWNLDDVLDDIKNGEGDFKDAPAEIREIVDKGIRKMNKFAKKMDDNILYYVASILDPRVKISFIES